MRSYFLWIFVGIFSVFVLTMFKLKLLEPMPGKKIRYRGGANGNKVVSEDKSRIYIYFGTRPEIIKTAPVIRRFQQSSQFDVVTIFTGQHPDLINPFLDIFDIAVDIWFDNVLQPNQSITDLISKIMLLTNKLKCRSSDIWMVQGDTSTAFAIATVAFHRGLRIAHVEAGLRTFNMYSPFPEEFNRKTISSIATFHFAPTKKNKEILLKEGIPEDHIFVTGNTVIDAVKYLQSHNKTKIPLNLQEVDLKDKILILVTLHRRENIHVIPNLYFTMKNVSCGKCVFLVPVHPNPNAGKAARDICKEDPHRFLCSHPLSYEEIHWVMTRSQFILTDSGGLQEEATWYHVPVLVLRESTERMEAVEAGVAALVGKDLKILREKIVALLNKSHPLWKEMSHRSFPFGYGNASEHIFNILESNKIFSAKEIIVNPNPPDKFPHARNLQPKNLRLKVFSPGTIGVVLQVFKRNSLRQQLEAVAKQTLVPRSVVVLQNGHYVDVSSTIQRFRLLHPKMEIQHIASSKNLRFHGRFYVAYMMRETYVSIWDDDVLPGSKWLDYCVKFSKSHGNALVGANGRNFVRLEKKEKKMLNKSSGKYDSVGHTWKMKQQDFIGRHDFVGHTWTLPREFLKYYLESEMLSLHTGEDIQLSFALQKVGIESWRPPQQKEERVGGIQGLGGERNVASYVQNQSPRELLFCKLLKAGFKPLSCTNCGDRKVIDSCIHSFEKESKLVEQSSQLTDRLHNNEIAWTVTNLTKPL